MATREENLKKINDELKKLSDDELEKVAGGVVKINYSVNDPSLQKPNQNPSEPVKYSYNPYRSY